MPPNYGPGNSSLAISNALQTGEFVITTACDSIIDATVNTGIAYTSVNGANAGAGGALTLQGCTVIGKAHAAELTLASNSIFWAKLATGGTRAAPLIADRKQAGCVRFSFLPVGAITPQRFKCVEQALASAQPIFLLLAALWRPRLRQAARGHQQRHTPGRFGWRRNGRLPPCAGPVAEVIAIEDLNITANTIADTVGRATANDQSSFLGYGADCLPTVEDLVVRDNVLTNWGLQPGLGVTGIFLLHGEKVAISRNQVVDNRGWADASAPDQTGNPTETAGAISIVMVTPPTLASDLTGLLALSIFEPGLPALRMEENLVRVSLGQALLAFGFGPFSVSDNHFSCGGNIPGTSASALQTVSILNFGVAIELIAPSAPSGLAGEAATGTVGFNSGPSFVSSSGAVIFTNNYCQLEVREVTQTNFASVIIISLDHLIFSNNHCWIDANVDTLGSGMTVDAFLLAGYAQCGQQPIPGGAKRRRSLGVDRRTVQHYFTEHPYLLHLAHRRKGA